MDFGKIMEIIKNKRILAIIGLVSLLLGVFLPYYTLSLLGYSDSISLWGYWEGKIVFILILANALFIFSDYIKKYIPQLYNSLLGKLIEKANNPKLSIIPTILCAAFIIYMFLDYGDASGYLDFGIGFYLLWIGIVCLVLHSIFYKKQV